MSRMWSQGVAVLAAAAWLEAAGPPAQAAFVFNFEAPNFTANESFPLADRSAAGGGFTANFAGAPGTSGAYTVGESTLDLGGFPFDVRPNALFAGQYLVASSVGVGPGPAIRVTFSRPVTELSVNFALSTLTSPVGGSLSLRTDAATLPFGRQDQAAGFVGGGQNAPGGTLTARFAVPVSQVTFQAVGTNGVTPIGFSLDNLTVSPVPAPPAVAMALTGLTSFGGLTAVRRRLAHATA